jgi:hypothetical protein
METESEKLKSNIAESIELQPFDLFYMYLIYWEACMIDSLIILLYARWAVLSDTFMTNVILQKAWNKHVFALKQDTKLATTIYNKLSLVVCLSDADTVLSGERSVNSFLIEEY